MSYISEELLKKLEHNFSDVAHICSIELGTKEKAIGPHTASLAKEYKENQRSL